MSDLSEFDKEKNSEGKECLENINECQEPKPEPKHKNHQNAEEKYSSLVDALVTLPEIPMRLCTSLASPGHSDTKFRGRWRVKINAKNC